MPDNTFDVVSKVELPEVSNSIQQSMKEITTRFDLKDSHSLIELKEKDNKIELDSKLKVQASIQGDFVRVSSRDRDTLQQVINLLRGTDFGIDVQFTNYRTN